MRSSAGLLKLGGEVGLMKVSGSFVEANDIMEDFKSMEEEFRVEC